MSADPSIFSIVSPSYPDLRRVLSESSRVFVCSPFFSGDGLAQLQTSVAGVTELECWTCLNVRNWVSGHADFLALAKTLMEIRDHKAKVLLREQSRMHAKLYYSIDRREALFGSCNLTDAGFGKNIEIGAIVSDSKCDAVDQWIQRERARTKEVDLDAFLDCVDVTKDAVKEAARLEAEGSPQQESELDAAISLFEKELLKSVPDVRTSGGKLSKRFGVGARIISTGEDVQRLLPSGWPTYEDFLDYLRTIKKGEAKILRDRALGLDGSNLSGHAKHFFWGLLFFFIENPAIARGIDSETFLQSHVYWGSVPWRSDWLRFLDDHEDDIFPSIDVWFHTIRTYLPHTFGGGTATGGAGSGNLKRMIAFLSQMLKARGLV